MQLTLFKRDVIYPYVLPEKKTGQYWVTHINEHGDEERVAGVEGIDGSWVLKSNRNTVIHTGNNEQVKEVIIEPLNFYNIYLKDANEKSLLYSEPMTDDRKCFIKLSLPAFGKLLVGRSEECDISFTNNFTSLRHAEITINDSSISIRDLNSSNGTFVNGIRIKEKLLGPGDVVYIMGLRIITGRGFIALNNPDGKMFYNHAVLHRLVNKYEVHDDEQCSTDETPVSSLFYRSPRLMRNIKRAEFRIDPPPPVGNLEETPLVLMLGPSITMGMTSLFTGLLTLQNVLRTNGDIMPALPTLMMSFSMLLGTILWPLLTKRYEKRKRIQRENLRQKKYREYIDGVRKDIADECMRQSEILHENHVTADNCADRILHRKRNLWERSHGQSDFLKVRLGIGSLPPDAEIKHPERKFSMEDDSLVDELYKLIEEPKVLEQVPITLSLAENIVSGIIGERGRVISLATGLIVQLVALHSYDELKLVFIYDKKESSTWEFVKWLPHVWSEDKAVRFVADNPNEVKELSSYFEREIKDRESLVREDDAEGASPHYVIFAMSKELAGRAKMADLILKNKKSHGFSIITLYDELKNLPKECSMIVELNDGTSKMYDKNDITGRFTAFSPDPAINQSVEGSAVELANIELDTSYESYNLPNMLTFLEMFGVGKIEHLNVLSRWKENNPAITLETPIGVDTTGELFKLDLHEKFHGPHGLIAGMTGSGKSEFIMSFILSMALNYHPDEVAFILIDYKGGGMANAFLNLPHLAGTITNLDGAAVKRSLVSIQSELKRRQAIFSETSKAVNVSNIDIYKYQKLYRDGMVNEPLQHLFIISDEFAELKTQQPEFMEQLVSAARIGRSLGIHLILATQKPSGVVDDQIWSNSKFRICLKVQEKADSMDVIKRPDAAELSVTGRFYVQVGFNELFTLGQSAWSGAPYYPVDRLVKKQDDSITIIDNLGRTIKQVRPNKRKAIEKNPSKQIDEIVKYLAGLAKEENIYVKPLWLEPIPQYVYIDSLKQKYSVSRASKYVLDPVIGEVDDPANQRQFILTLPITREGNTLVYGAAGSGKTTFLTSLVYSLMEDHTPDELNLYILDFGSETLRAFYAAPHVGDVLLSNEGEKINNLFKLLNKEIETRKKLFSDYGGDYRSYIKAPGADIASIVVIIHNYSAFAETYEDKEEAVAYLTREGVKYGIYFVITALNTGAVRYRIMQNFRQILVLQLNDKSDYSSVLGSVDGTYPSKYKGRGIYRADRVYEFQTAHILHQIDNTLKFVRDYCSDYARRWPHAPARRIPILPDKVDANYLAAEISCGVDVGIPIGIERNSLDVARYNFHKAYINLVLSQNNDNGSFVQGLAEVMAAKECMEVVAVDPEAMFDPGGEIRYRYIDKELDNAVIEMFNTLVYRNNTFKNAREKGEEVPEFGRIVYIINSMSALMSGISDDSRDKLNVLLDKGDVIYNVSFIIADSESSISSVSHQEWFRTKVPLNEGIWVGSGIAQQYQFKLSKISSDLYEEIGDDFGYMINRGRARLIRLLSPIDDSGVRMDG